MILFKGKESEVLAFYTLAALIALFTAIWSFQTGTVAVEGGNNPTTAYLFFLYIIGFTLLFLFLIYVLRERVRLLILFLELFFLFVTSLFFFSIVSDLAGLAWAGFLTLGRFLFPENRMFRNTSVAIIAGVSSGLLGASLSPIVALILYVFMILYDFTSVFLTGHMVKLAKSIEEGIGRGDLVALGGGDLVLPMLFSTSLIPYSPFTAILSTFFAIAGVYLTFRFLRLLNRPLPALPYIGAVQLSVTALSLFLSIPFR